MSSIDDPRVRKRLKTSDQILKPSSNQRSNSPIIVIEPPPNYTASTKLHEDSASPKRLGGLDDSMPFANRGPETLYSENSSVRADSFAEVSSSSRDTSFDVSFDDHSTHSSVDLFGPGNLNEGLLRVDHKMQFPVELDNENYSTNNHSSITNLRFPDCQKRGTHEPPSENVERESIGTSEVQHELRSEEALDAHSMIPPLNISWAQPEVQKSEIPTLISKPSIADITDLGDRNYHANLKAISWNSNRPIASPLDKPDFALQSLFFNNIVRAPGERRGFLPRTKISELVTYDRVLNELGKLLKDSHSSRMLEDLARKICQEEPQPNDPEDNRPPKIKSFKKIFTILVLMERTRSISRFVDEDVNDLDLPLTRQYQNKGSMIQLHRSYDLNTKLNCFENWTPFGITTFDDWQWTTVSPFFGRGIRKHVPHVRIPNSTILPFTSGGRYDRYDTESRLEGELEGASGCVFKVGIHPDHHNFDLTKLTNKAFAIKELKSPNQEHFRKEVDMLKLFNDDYDEHLVSLLATYEQNGKYYLIFSWADYDLNNYWTVGNPCPVFDKKTILWVAKQCRGIARGLSLVHKIRSNNSDTLQTFSPKSYGRHGDLKPQNILWFAGPAGAVLKISDFGLSEYSTIHSKSYQSRSKVHGASASYRPPEWDLTDSKIGPSYDIWALGCLYLEFITWLIGGSTLLDDFVQLRTSYDPGWFHFDTDSFFELVKGESIDGSRREIIAARVKPAVTKFIATLHEHKSCTGLLHEMLRLIERDMLIVKPVNTQERGRISSKEIYQELSKMLEKCNDENYACKPQPLCYRPVLKEEAVEIEVTDEDAEVFLRRNVLVHGIKIQERPQSPQKRSGNYDRNRNKPEVTLRFVKADNMPSS